MLPEGDHHYATQKSKVSTAQPGARNKVSQGPHRQDAEAESGEFETKKSGGYQPARKSGRDPSSVQRKSTRNTNLENRDPSGAKRETGTSKDSKTL